ncbi:hypothetical protein, partial [Streptomyces viridosporus]|uniref:hypothetical protein n=1 Tax=Streptomyces viridosporus TaxID=67581 RepID=UPI001AD8327D
MAETVAAATDIDADTQVPAIVAQPLTDALPGRLPTVLPGHRGLFSRLRPGGRPYASAAARSASSTGRISG